MIYIVLICTFFYYSFFLPSATVLFSWRLKTKANNNTNPKPKLTPKPTPAQTSPAQKCDVVGAQAQLIKMTSLI
jgi:hypothetical protein